MVSESRINKITVVGAGLMGHGIAQDFAVAGFEVRLSDVSEDRLRDALSDIEANLALLGELGLVSQQDAAPALRHISTTVSLDQAVDGADLVIEAVFEDLALKREIFARLDRLCAEGVVLASNTSTFLPSQLAEATARPERVLVAHYFNPPYLMPLVEVVPGPQTAEEVVDAVASLLERIGKRPVVLRRELPGFVVNRLQTALLREALSIVQRGVASPQDVDMMVRHSFGRRSAVAGPFEVFDSSGWDTIAAVMTQLMPDLDTSSDVPAPVRDMVARGDLGMKSGRGFYEWDAESERDFRRRIGRAAAAIERLSRDHQTPKPKSTEGMTMQQRNGR